MVAVLHPTGPGSQIVIDRAVVLVGRGSDCDAIIDFSSKISRMHCVLVQVDANYYIRDLGSMNGVRVNGERVDKEMKLVQGAEVAIGDVMFLFDANVQPAPRVAVRTHGGVKGMPSILGGSSMLGFHWAQRLAGHCSVSWLGSAPRPLVGREFQNQGPMPNCCSIRSSIRLEVSSPSCVAMNTLLK